MSTQVELAKEQLFGQNAMGVQNLKFFPGSSREVSSEQMAGQIIKALASIAAGDFDVVDGDDCA